jgi:hypothetical protein
MVTLRSTSSVYETADDFYEPLSRRLDAMMNDYSPGELHLVERFVTGLRATMNDYLDRATEMNGPFHSGSRNTSSLGL